MVQEEDCLVDCLFHILIYECFEHVLFEIILKTLLPISGSCCDSILEQLARLLIDVAVNKFIQRHYKMIKIPQGRCYHSTNKLIAALLCA